MKKSTHINKVWHDLEEVKWKRTPEKVGINLFIDPFTEILYFGRAKHGIVDSLCPYIGPHGKYCTIKDGNIVEID